MNQLRVFAFGLLLSSKLWAVCLFLTDDKSLKRFPSVTEVFCLEPQKAKDTWDLSYRRGEAPHQTELALFHTQKIDTQSSDEGRKEIYAVAGASKAVFRKFEIQLIYSKDIDLAKEKGTGVLRMGEVNFYFASRKE